MGIQTISDIGVGASEFLGVQRIFAQTCPKSCRANFADRFLVWPPKNGLHLLFCKRWAPYLKSNNVGRHFCSDFQRFCLDIWGFCPVFAQIFRYFAQIFNKSKLLGVCLHPRLLHQWYQSIFCF